MTPAELTAWRKRQGLSRERASEALGISASQLFDYETGRKRGTTRAAPIPKTIALACAAIEAGLEVPQTVTVAVTSTEETPPMTYIAKRRAIEAQLTDIGLRLERGPHFVEQADGGSWTANWIVRPGTTGSCMAREIIPLRRLADAAGVIGMYQIRRRD